MIYAEVKSNREIQLWKYIGDEVVFYVQVTSLQSIAEYVRYIYRALLRLCSKKIGAGSSAVPVSLKATAWIAAVANKVDKKKNTENYFLLTREGQDQFNEFLGPEIDKGFRIAKAAEKGQFVLSYELACLFFEAVEAESGMGVLKTGPCIVSYKQFKGVWNDGEYPVIKYKAGSEDRIRNSRDGLRVLLDEDRNREKIEHIKTVIENPGDVFLRTKNPHVEFHCTAICYSEKGIMIAKRKHRSHDNDCWDFGGGPITASYDIKKNLKDRYLCDFGLEIEPETVLLGNEAEPVPVTLFEMQLESGKYLFGSAILSEIKGGKTAVNKARRKGGFCICITVYHPVGTFSVKRERPSRPIPISNP